MTTERIPQVSAGERATDTPGDVSPFALGLLMRRAHDRAAGALVEALRPLGLELRHFAVLIALNANGVMNQSALVASVGSDKASMVRVIDDLEARGLVGRRPYPGDRRVHLVEMTAQGLAAFDAAHVTARPDLSRAAARQPATGNPPATPAGLFGLPGRRPGHQQGRRS
jgi:DNA-binding MarR family transcriptional regulator